MEALLDSRPSLGELTRQVCLESEWYQIGVRLDLNPDKLKAMRHSSISEDDKTSDMYKLWLDSQPQATRRQLIEVLEGMDLNRQAHDYKKYLKSKQGNDHTSDGGDKKQASDPNSIHKPLPIDGSISPALSVQMDDISRLSEFVKSGSCHLTVHAHIHVCTCRCMTGRECEIDLPDFRHDFTHTSDNGRVFRRAGYHREEQVNIKSKGIAAPIKQVHGHASGDTDRKQVLKLSDLIKSHKKTQKSILFPFDGFISRALPVQKDDLLHLPKLVKKGSPDSVHVKACMTRCEIELDEDLLDPEFDRDFTHISDDRRVYYQGGYPYKRPCGWMRMALKVKGMYEDDTWLGTPGDRSSHGEWPVSYHGTSREAAMGIANRGYDHEKWKRCVYGRGHYSIPDIEVAAEYSSSFKTHGKQYKIVMQNKVNLKNSKIIPKEKTGGKADYYVTPSDVDIRAYGICIKEI